MGYEYYEFQRLDGPLTDKQREELDEISSRSSPTRHAISFEYNYSELRADPADLMRRYFDAGLHLSKYGTRRVMFRFPRNERLADSLAEYRLHSVLQLDTTDNRILLDCTVSSPELGGWIPTGEGELDALVELRDELLDGDLRAAYLMWLAGIAGVGTDVSPDDPEPPVPPGLDALTDPQQQLCDFFGIDDHRLAPARAASADSPAGDEPDWEAAVDDLTEETRRQFLARIARGDTDAVAELRATLRNTIESAPLNNCRTTGRTVEDYWDAVHRHTDQRT